MKHPLLFLGLMGFDAQSEAQVRRWVEQNAAPEGDGELAEQHPIWQVVNFDEADALLIRGAGVAQRIGSYLQFLPALKQVITHAHTPSPLGIDLADVKLPFALSDEVHLQSLGVDTTEKVLFDLSQDSSLLQAIQQLEKSLRPLRALFALADELTERQQELDLNHTYHLERNGALAAIVDMPQRRVLLSPNMRPIDIGTDAWLRRPKSASFAPSHFVVCSLQELGWVYAMHSPSVKLPKRYRALPIYVRHNPRIRGTLLNPRHATLMDQLWHGPQTYAQILQLRPELKEWLARDLNALYLTRSITTQKPGQTGRDPSSLPASFSHTHPGMQQHFRPPTDQMAHLQTAERTHTVIDSLERLF